MYRSDKLNLLLAILLALMTLPSLVNSQANPILDTGADLIINGALPPYDKFPESDISYQTFDFIVVGAGPAGCTVASRLSEISRFSVLLLEAGPEESFIGETPLINEAMITSPTYNWGYKMEKEDGVCRGGVGGRCDWPNGKGVGGGTLVNAMVWTRGDPTDYDKWAALGNDGWSYSDILPYFIKSETMDIPSLRNSPFHGTRGPVHLNYPSYQHDLSRAFQRAGREIGLNYSDYNNPNERIGFSRIQASLHKGRRFSAAKAYLWPARYRRNLVVQKYAFVTKIIIKNRRAVGVDVILGKNFEQKVKVFARREVIVTAGGFNSPKLLMLSGIGPQQHLQSLGIPVIQNLSVGYNLQEHVSTASLAFLVNVTDAGLQWDLPLIPTIQSVKEVALFGQGRYSILGCESFAYAQTKYATGRVPDIEFLFVTGSLAVDCGKVQQKSRYLDEGFYKRQYSNICYKTAWNIWPMLLYPKSRGTVKLRSRNPFDDPIIHGNFLSNEQDLITLVDALKIVLRISKTKALQKYGSKLYSKPMEGCTQYVFESDEYLGCLVRQITTMFHHQCGTCRMGPDSDRDAVVDNRLRVRGVKGLRVADTSIMPEIIAGHTMAVAYAIGEKAADMIKEDNL
ncbi:glucose dehydrogenase [FAD, quinone]-like [Nilaparvata lugens]|uniref:glucose dehydrogenase [FAD, quinone]-like n=1 Tax=Nilaparvata lugens TaxID=108931 RepID=UPI00193CC5A7|nr:glucose dehydrogenase [FAD, quinone]-like [Nilaparvata lugens]